MLNDFIINCPMKCISCYTDNRSLNVSWKDNIPENEIDACLDLINSLVKALSVQNLQLNGSKLKDYAIGLNWKIIETCWQAFCENGGKKIILINKSRLPKYMEEEYANAIKEYGIPIELEFKGEKTENLPIEKVNA